MPFLKSSGQLGAIMSNCKGVFHINDDLLLLQYGGVHKLVADSSQLVKALSGNFNYSYEPIIAKSDGRGYFTSQETELWETDGTLDGTFKRLDLESKPVIMEIRGDSLHLFYGGDFPVHHAYNLDTWDSVSDSLPFAPISNTVHEDYVLLNGSTDAVMEIYNLTTRNLRYLDNSGNRGFRWNEMKKINGRYFAAGTSPLFSTSGHRQYNFSWIDFEEMTVENPVITDPLYMTGFADIFSTDHGLVMFRNTGDEGCELYAIDEDFNPSLLKDIYPGISSGINHPSFGNMSLIQHFILNTQATALNEKVYFAGLSPSNGNELWRTDGTKEGTVRIADFLKGASGSSWIKPLLVGDKLYALSHDGVKNSLYEIDPDYEGYSDPSESNNKNEWTQFIFREGQSYEYYHSPLKDPVLLETKNGLVGLIQGFRKESANYLDKISSADGKINEEVADIPFQFNGNILYSLNDSGGVEWHKWVVAYGDECDMALSEDGENLFLVFSHRDSTLIGDYKIAQSGLATGLAMLSSGGRVIWHSIFNELRDMRVHDIEASGDKVFISGYYFQGSLDIGNGVTASSPYNPQYFAAAFDFDGNALWAANTPMEGLTRYSTLGHLAIDPEDGRVFTATADHTLTTWNSCEYGTWNGRLNALDMSSGSFLWQANFTCNDKFRIRDISVDDRGNLWVGGNFRGTFTYSGGNEISAEGESCPTNSFIAIVNGYSGELSGHIIDRSIPKRFQRFLKRKGIMEALYLTAVDEHEDFMYPLPDRAVFAVEKSAFSLSGTQIATETFPTRMGVYFGFDSDEEIKIAASNVGTNGFALKFFIGGGSLGLGNHSAPPYYNWCKAATTIIRRQHLFLGLPDFDLSEPAVENGFKIYPNPLSGQTITLSIDPDRVPEFHTLSISDMSGRQLFKTPLLTRYSSAFYSIPSLGAGTYVVTIYGENSSESQLLMIED
mgnify:FL=1